ncbi:type I-E CRISPR-associated protein Cas6/Cse3/CasE [Anaerolineae bacterium CFX9]|nr:type I-E CRISPR-associated protein Cas6/Cse3/CasE [Anaerolineae bacterium CFX9]
MYLSQLILSLRSREARFDLSDRYELHRTLLRAFPAALPEDERILYRVENQQRLPVVPIIVQSHELPNWSAAERLQMPKYLFRAPAVRLVEPRVKAGDRCRFRLQANPTVKRDGKRHALYGENDLRAWLARKGETHGFSVEADQVQVVKVGKTYGKKRAQTWHAVQFDGTLTVTDSDAFIGALLNGVGSAKAFGFGLLSVPYPAVV